MLNNATNSFYLQEELGLKIKILESKQGSFKRMKNKYKETITFIEVKTNNRYTITEQNTLMQLIK